MTENWTKEQQEEQLKIERRQLIFATGYLWLAYMSFGLLVFSFHPVTSALLLTNGVFMGFMSRQGLKGFVMEETKTIAAMRLQPSLKRYVIYFALLALMIGVHLAIEPFFVS